MPDGRTSTFSPPITQIRDRLEAKAGAVSGTREYWDCVAALLDVAETAERVIGAFSNTYFTAARQEGKTRIAAALNDLHDALAQLVPSATPQHYDEGRDNK